MSGSRQALALCLLALPLVLAGGCDSETTAVEPRARSVSASEGGEAADPTIEIRNANLRVTPHARLAVRHLRGATVRTRAEEPVFFDRPDSFAVRIEEAEVALDEESLAALLNEWVFARSDAPLERLEAEIEPDRLILRGNLAKAVPVPFTIEGTIVVDDGDLRMTPRAVKAAGLPVGGLLDLLDLEMVDLINADEARGVRLDKNDILLLTSGVVPPPRILGRVQEVRLEDGRLVQRLGPPADAPGPRREPPPPGDPEAANYLYFYGGTVRFGNLTMYPTDLQIADSDPSDPFDFYLARLPQQLVAGSSHTLADDGLLTVLPDYDDLEGSDGVRARDRDRTADDL